ncbi:MAG TPA: DinB family protein [Bryobacteraceae bacterium]|nr:DinB family protein [Bryobacteraceae bacterium]
MNQLPEPWLRGIDANHDPVIGHLLRSSQQIREDISQAVSGLTLEQIWSRPNGAASVGFHARHLAGSTDRLCTYLEGRQLSAEQLAELKNEAEPGEDAASLLARIDTALDRYESLLRSLMPDQFATIREIGRRRLQTTAIGLAIHIAEHGQRHTGQATSIAKIVCSG